MATYIRSITVWDKNSLSEFPASALQEIDDKKTAMREAGTMQADEEYSETETRATISYKFTTQAAANEWLSFIDTIATTNNLNKISSRTVSVSHAN